MSNTRRPVHQYEMQFVDEYIYHDDYYCDYGDHYYFYYFD